MYKILFICLVPLCLAAKPAKFDSDLKSFLTSFVEDRECSKINLSGNFMKFNENEDGKTSIIDYFQLYIFNEEDPLSNSDKKKLNNKISRSKLELINEIRSDGNKIQIYVKDKKDKIQEIFMIVHGDDKSIIFHAEGEIYYSDLDELDIDFDGSDSLKQVKH